MTYNKVENIPLAVLKKYEGKAMEREIAWTMSTRFGYTGKHVNLVDR